MRFKLLFLLLLFISCFALTPYVENVVSMGYEIPHAEYTNNTNVCRICHSPHLGQAEKLIVATTIRDSCYMCHDGRGSKYDVKNGKTDLEISASESIKVDSISGGFNPLAGFTSSHLIEEMNAPSGGSGESVFLTCTSCHNPHGSDNYRLIPFSVNGKDIRVKGRVIESPFAKREVATYDSGISEMCSTCHNDYNFKNAEEGVYDKTKHRHPIGVGLDSGEELLFTTLPTEAAPSGAYPLPETVVTTDGSLGTGTYYYIVTTSNITVNDLLEEVSQESHQGYIKKVTVTLDNSNVTLKWQDITNALHYSVYRAGPVDIEPSDLTEYKLVASSSTEAQQGRFIYTDGFFTFADNGSLLESITKHPPIANGQGRVACITCHTAHGTKKVDVYTGESMLKRLDNRGVCQDCHKK